MGMCVGMGYVDMGMYVGMYVGMCIQYVGMLYVEVCRYVYVVSGSV